MKTPRMKEDEVRRLLATHATPGRWDPEKVAVLAIRGYYLDTMGKPGQNDRRIYDDAMFVVWPDGMAAFQANTDPNGYRSGHGFGRYKGMAMLHPGTHIYGTGKHKGRKAFRQAEKFTVIRDGKPPYKHVGFHAINLHSGGKDSTSSLGCQTVPATTWPAFRDLIYDLLPVYDNPWSKNDWGERVRTFPYVLIERKS